MGYGSTGFEFVCLVGYVSTAGDRFLVRGVRLHLGCAILRVGYGSTYCVRGTPQFPPSTRWGSAAARATVWTSHAREILGPLLSAEEGGKVPESMTHTRSSGYAIKL